MTIYNENVRYNWDVFLRLLWWYSKDRKWVGFYYFKVDLIFALNVRQRIHIFHIGKKTLQLSRKLYSSHCLKPVISGSRFTTSIAWGIFTTTTTDISSKQIATCETILRAFFVPLQWLLICFQSVWVAKQKRGFKIAVNVILVGEEAHKNQGPTHLQKDTKNGTAYNGVVLAMLDCKK